MSDSEGSTSSDSQDEKDNKLEQYQIINKQLSKTITAFKIKISSLTNNIKQLEIENLNYRNETFQWKNKYSILREIHLEHITLMTRELQSNAEKLNGLFDDDEFNKNGETIAGKNGADHLSTSLPTSSKSFDTSRRISKSFELPKSARHLPQVHDEEVSELVTIDEESEGETEDEIERQIGEEPNEGRETETVTQGELDEDSHVENEEEPDNESEEERGEENEEESGEESGNESEEETESGEETESEKESGQETDEQDEDEHPKENESKILEKISLTTTRYESTITNGDTNKENEWPSTTVESTATHSTIESSQSFLKVNSESSVSVNSRSCVSVDSQSIISVENQSQVTVESESSESDNSQSILSSNSQASRHAASQSIDKSAVEASSKKLPMKEKFAPNRNDTRLQPNVMVNNSFGHLKVPDLVSSTPYQDKNSRKKTSKDKEKSRQAPVSPIPSNTIRSPRNRSPSSRASISNTEIANTTSLTGRPKRKVATIVYEEPKLNVKLRRPLT